MIQKIQKSVEVPQIQYTDKIVGMPKTQEFQTTVDIPQIQHIDTIVNVPTCGKRDSTASLRSMAMSQSLYELAIFTECDSRSTCVFIFAAFGMGKMGMVKMGLGDVHAYRKPLC
jgi:hypothetical protein